MSRKTGMTTGKAHDREVARMGAQKIPGLQSITAPRTLNFYLGC